MPGYIGYLSKSKVVIPHSKREDFVVNTYFDNFFYIEQHTINKFINDKVFFEYNNTFFLVEGVILNKSILLAKYNVVDLQSLVINLNYNLGDNFINEFKGSFSIVVYQKKERELKLYTNQIGDKSVYVFHKDDILIFSTDLIPLIDILKANRLKPELSLSGAYSLLSYGYQLETETLLNNVVKLKGGTYFNFNATNKISKIVAYHKFTSAANLNLSIDRAVEQLDELFTSAVSMQITKNKEYNYLNFATLSAGLDSRMVVFAAKKLMDEPLHCITYSQSDYYDDTTSKAIANDLKCHWLFKPLDNGLSLYFNDEILQITGASVLNYGPCQVWDTFQILDKEKMGLVHTGMLGDVVVGSFYKSLKYNTEYFIGDGAYSKRLIPKLKNVFNNSSFNCYNNYEEFSFYNRGFNGANMGAPMVYQYNSESFSPFYDKDVLEFCLKLPLKFRINHKLYLHWIKEKYPLALRYPRNGKKLNSNIKFLFRGIEYTPNQLINKVYLKVRKKLNIPYISTNSASHMNPLDYWLSKNNELRAYYDNYFNEYNYLIEEKELAEDLKLLYKEGTATEKNQVITLLSFVKYLNE